jgi:glycosyltransferase involved in cell wall biosynthesis
LRVGVIHDSLRLAGGGERVCLKTIEGLRERDHEVVLGTVEPTDWEKLERVMGPCARPSREVHLLSLSETPLRLYAGAVIPLVRAAMPGSCDLLVQTNGDVVPIGDVIYMHYLPASICPDGSYREGNPLLRKLYSRPYATIYRQLISRVRVDATLANSKFTRDAIRRCVNRDATVIHPPVEVTKFEGARGQVRRPTVTACGRFSPEKNFEFVLELASAMPQCEFSIIGTVTSVATRKYYERLRQMKETKSLGNVELIQNESFSRMLDCFAQSRVFVNPKINEPFGLSVVEAMAAGMVPVVHRSGGPWTDTLGEVDGAYGYSYADKEEAVSTIRLLLGDSNLCASIEQRNLSRARSFSDVEFKRRISEVVLQTAKALDQ